MNFRHLTSEICSFAGCGKPRAIDYKYAICADHINKKRDGSINQSATIITYMHKSPRLLCWSCDAVSVEGNIGCAKHKLCLYLDNDGKRCYEMPGACGRCDQHSIECSVQDCTNRIDIMHSSLKICKSCVDIARFDYNMAWCSSKGCRVRLLGAEKKRCRAHEQPCVKDGCAQLAIDKFGRCREHLTECISCTEPSIADNKGYCYCLAHYAAAYPELLTVYV